MRIPVLLDDELYGINVQTAVEQVPVDLLATADAITSYIVKPNVPIARADVLRV
ncbi:hypothetical protein PF008_g22874 [Phytophthora fragariae]|uniref:Uncharacterized protein n=1 Tax=Phytophthora fragariae TaxID=53985 RepID=A0A6G0QTE1_9STRA|nr:hypothetical protein PF008_g22874 [Phytophthora fragariae]